MLLNPKTPIAVGTVIILVLVAMLAKYAPMPGGLSSAHAKVRKLTTAEGCVHCHSEGGLAEGCLDCHQEIAAQIWGGSGIHHFLLDDEVACRSCHSEHNGASFDLVSEASWGPYVKAAYRHPHTEFKLAGKHEQLDCSECHTEKRDSEFSLGGEFGHHKRAESFLGLTQECTACHEDVHTDGISGDCSSCHGQEWFRPTVGFDHGAKFPLEGGHERLECAECHVLPEADDRRRPHPFPFDRVRGRDCESCHRSPHHTFVGNCRDCHQLSESHWRGAMLHVSDALHAQTGFKLGVPHDGVACAGCHPHELTLEERYHDPAVPGYARNQLNCAACHRDEHLGQFGEKGANCVGCHSPSGFLPAAFGVDDHSSAFALSGAHRATACSACHTIPADEKTRRFVGTSKSCKGCHATPHGPQFSREIETGDCDSCHRKDAVSFEIRPYDHAKASNYALEGGHAKALCNDCHVQIESPGVEGVVRRYEGTPRDCGGCHRDVHRGQFRDYESCSSCHRSFELWTITTFDHNTQSQFKLDGAHEKVKCSKCHRRVEVEGEEVVHYKPLGTECQSCHEFSSE